MYRGKTVSVVLPVYNERENIRNAIEQFLAHPAVDEVVAVSNNSNDGSDDEIAKTRAVHVRESLQGYGAALQRGMQEATGELIVTTEPDGTFFVGDLDRFLSAGETYDVVIGSRTHASYILPGANMDFALKWGNWAVARMLQILFLGPHQTDVGHGYKLMHRQAYERIRGRLTVQGSHFSPDFMMQAILARVSIKEIPIHYGPRIGTSKITGDRMKAVRLGFRMIFLILATRWKTLWQRGAAKSQPLHG